MKSSQRHPVQNDATMLITAVTKHRAMLFADPACAREAVESFYRVRKLRPLLLFGFVAMPDHVHALVFVESPERISRIVRQYKIGVAYALNRGSIWQDRFDLRIVRDTGAALAYIHQNPVRAGLVNTLEDYPWSSAHSQWSVDDFGP